ncbi:patatin-like phospholipase family protein [Pontibacter anaerobius]|uniref:Patatin-like phospholipase family protein n=1 Tax=Pontibacter anaerobius TaxID=2993940 RepID=A0ABT3RFX1_9BACT|nr:patatin-like phospholipase family protein [Pontibacter anaerobius]MCX2740293.1 patatin-like phospholipase family protein [Pontibacter anaerobius]
MRHYLFSLLFLLSAFAPAQVVAQAWAAPSAKRPKIGLVLSGGGAKGMAHIGFLKVLEEAGIRPDYITGTSMGSLVGALYALGYSASEIEEIALKQDWEMLLSNQVPLSQIAMEEKEYYGRYLLELPVNGTKISFPSGLIEGQALNNLLIRLTRGAHSIQDFSQLPIPFACVATDLATGQKVVLRQGFLPEALRASMAIPTVFTPIKIDGRVLVDGGLVQNFPVQEALDMGADFVIGVNVGGGLEPEQNLKSMLDVLVQATFFTSASNLESEKKKTDLLVDILPYLEDYNTGSFADTEEVIKIGELVARQYEDSLRTLARYFRSFREPMHKPALSNLQDSVKIGKVLISGTNSTPRRILRRRLRLKENETTTISSIENRIEVLYGTGHFNKVSYAMVPSDSGHHLQVNVEEAAEGALKTAIYYDSENRAGATVNFTRRNLFWQGSRFVAEVDLGQNIRTDVNYLKYMGYRYHIAVKLGSQYYKNDLSLFNDNGSKIAILQQNMNIGTLGWQTTTNNTWTLGQQMEYKLARLYPQVAGQLNLDTLTVDINWLEQLKVRNWAINSFFRLNTLDRQVFPTRGWKTDLQGSFIFGSRFTLRAQPGHPELESSIRNDDIDPYFRVSLKANGVVPLRRNLSLMLRQGLVMYTSNDLPVGEEVKIGGYTSVLPNMVEYRAAEPFAYSADNLIYGGLGLQAELRKKLYLQLSSTVINTSLLHGYRTLRGKSTRLGYSATLGYLTPFGPITAGAAHEKDAEWRGFISLGFRLPW